MAFDPVRAQQARDYFISLGYAPHQAAGIVGNLIQESGLRTNARNPGDGRDGSDSIGVGQWNGNRARGLHSFASSKGASPTDFQTQLAYVDHELKNGGERRAYDRLMASKDVPGATAAMISYERPAGFTWDNPTAGHGWSNRLNNAMQVAGVKGEVPALSQTAGVPQAEPSAGGVPSFSAPAPSAPQAQPPASLFAALAGSPNASGGGGQQGILGALGDIMGSAPAPQPMQMKPMQAPQGPTLADILNNFTPGGFA